MSNDFLIKIFYLWPIFIEKLLRLNPLANEEIRQFYSANFSIIPSYSFPIGSSSIKLSNQKNDNDVSYWEKCN